MKKTKTSNAAGNSGRADKALPVLRAASDQNVLFALEALKKSGKFMEVLPEYEEIAAEIERMGRPALDSKQLSRSIIRLKRFGYIKSIQRDELVGISA